MATFEKNKSQERAGSRQKLLYLTTAALFAALICLCTAYLFHVPVGANGGYVHVGDSLIYLAASLLPLPYAMAAAGIGGALADLLTAPAWTVATFVIKIVITLPFTCKKENILPVRNVIGVVVAGILSFTGYYIADVLLFGTWGALLPAIAGSLVQSGGSAIVYLTLGFFLDRMGFKQTLKNRFGI